MVPHITQTAQVFEGRAEKEFKIGQAASIFRSLAFIERNSLNRMHRIVELDAYYGAMDLIFANRYHEIDNLQTIGQVFIGFAKVRHFPSAFYPWFKKQLISILFNDRKEKVDQAFFEGWVAAIRREQQLTRRLRSFPANDQLTPSEVEERNQVSIQLSLLQKQLQADFWHAFSQSNGIFSQVGTITALSKFAGHLNREDPQFLEDFYIILAQSLEDMHRHNELVPFLIRHVSPSIFSSLMRSVHQRYLQLVLP
jgi:hypothetical protein